MGSAYSPIDGAMLRLAPTLPLPAGFPSCIIVDLDLPEGEGTEVLKQLDGILVLALIKSQNVERRAEAIGLGADEVLRTTGPAEKMAAAVERLISPRSITAF
jgi:DNA-binding NarL/FixJ family response regulator